MGTIWKYQDCNRDDITRLIEISICPYCNSPLLSIYEDIVEYQNEDWKRERDVTNISMCQVCGWWKSKKDHLDIYLGKYTKMMANALFRYGAISSLKELDLANIDVPIEEARLYLSANFNSRFEIHPRKLELVIGSIFLDLGYDILVTAYSKDNGIDVFLYKNSEIIGVQVKRYRNSIEVEQIRSLAGALVYSGKTHGMFITTSSFQKGVNETINQYLKRGLKIELMDSKRLFDALSIAQIKNFKKPDNDEIKFYLSKLSEFDASGGI